MSRHISNGIKSVQNNSPKLGMPRHIYPLGSKVSKIIHWGLECPDMYLHWDKKFPDVFTGSQDVQTCISIGTRSSQTYSQGPKMSKHLPGIQMPELKRIHSPCPYVCHRRIQHEQASKDRIRKKDSSRIFQLCFLQLLRSQKIGHIQPSVHSHSRLLLMDFYPKRGREVPCWAGCMEITTLGWTDATAMEIITLGWTELMQ